jgi:hypothetical protein
MQKNPLSLFLLTNLLFSTGFVAMLTAVQLVLPGWLDVPTGMAQTHLITAFFTLYFASNFIGGYVGQYFNLYRATLTGGLLSVIGMMMLSLDHFLLLGTACFLLGSGLVRPTMMQHLNLTTRQYNLNGRQVFAGLYLTECLGTVLGFIFLTTLMPFMGDRTSIMLAASLSLMATFLMIFIQHRHEDSTFHTPERPAAWAALILILALSIAGITGLFYLQDFFTVMYVIFTLGVISVIIFAYHMLFARTGLIRRQILLVGLGTLITSWFWQTLSLLIGMTQRIITPELMHASTQRFGITFFPALALHSACAIVFSVGFFVGFKYWKPKLHVALPIALVPMGISLLLYAHVLGQFHFVSLGVVLVTYSLFGLGCSLMAPTIMHVIGRYAPKHQGSSFYGINLLWVGITWLTCERIIRAQGLNQFSVFDQSYYHGVFLNMGIATLVLAVLACGIKFIKR